MVNAITRKHVHESNIIEGFDDYDVDTQSLLAWDWLRRKKVITHEVIQELNKRLTAHQEDLDDMWRGTYRSRSRVRVYIGGREGAKPSMVQGLMDNWLLDFLTLTPKEAHIRFESIHPFIDGNGRTGRMLMWWHELKLGKKLSLIEKENVDEYYRWFQ